MASYDALDYSAIAADEPSATANGGGGGGDHGWKKVTYPKRQRRQQQAAAGGDHRPNGIPGDRSSSQIFASVEQRAAERRRALEAAAAVAAAAEAPAPARSRHAGSDDDDEDSGAEGATHGAQENGGDAAKKAKAKKPKKPKVTVAEAAAKIDAADLAAFLAEALASYESQQDIQLMRFADYFARAFAPVTAAQFPWAKMFKEAPVSKIIDIPLCHISESVYKTSGDWIAQKSPDALGNFVIWCLDSILADLASQQPAGKGSKKAAQQPSSKAQVAIFVVLAITLRRKPDIMINLLTKLRDNTRYQGQDKLPVIVWVIGQASQGDPVVGLYSWAHYLLPTICGKSSCNPQSRDFILQLVERILSAPKARPILLNGAVRKGERLVPPPALDLLMRATFPVPSARIKATERFEAVYPTLKEIALAGSPGTKTTKQASQQLLPNLVKAMQEGNPELTKEAADIFIWCLTQNAECYKQWEKLHLDNADASVAVLKELTTEWKECSAKFSSADALRETVKHLVAMNEEALSGDADAKKQAAIRDADKYCKAILGKLTRRSGCMKGGLIVVLLAVGLGVAMSPNVESLHWKNLHAAFSSVLSF